MRLNLLYAERMDLQPLRDEFATVYLPSRNLAENTRATYLRVVDACLGYLAEQGVTQVEAVGLRDLNSYFAHLDRLGRSGTTRRLHTHALKAFFRFLEEHQHVTLSAAVRLIPPKSEERTTRVLSEAEYRRLRDAVGHRPRMAAIVELMLQTGIRIGELVKLQLRDVQLPSVSAEERGQLGELWIRQGKGRKDRRLPLNRRVCGALRTYLAVRPEAETTSLFVSKLHKPLSARAVEHLFHKYLAIARIEDASPHTLRHTMATPMIKSGATLRSVQEMLGHANIQTTSRYVSLAEEQLHKDVQDHAL